MIGAPLKDERNPGIRPRPTAWRRLDAMARAAFPVTSTALLILLLSAPLDLPGQAALMPAASLAAVFFWSLYRPAAIPPPAIFLLGLLADLLGDAPLGIQVLTLLITHGVTLRWRRQLLRQGAMVVWLSFAGISAAAALFEWGLTSLLDFVLLPSLPAIFQAVLGAALYPLLAGPFAAAHRSIAAPERA